MGFLNPQVLYLLGLAGLPILIHFLGRKKYKEVYFSDIRLLKNLEKDAIRKVKISQILVLLLRTLIILFLILSFAKPYLSEVVKSLFIRKNSRLNLVIDNSLSMSCLVNNSNVLEESISYLSALSQKFEYPFYLSVYTTTNNKPVIKDRRIEAEEDFISSIKRISITNLEGKLDITLSNILKEIEGNENVENYVWIVTDLQESNLGSGNEISNMINGLNKWDIVPVIIKTDFELKNFAITGNLSTGLISTNNPLIVNLQINNWDTVASEIPVTLYVNDEKVGKDVVNIEPVGREVVQFKIMPQKNGFTTGYAEIRNDNLPADNKWYFVVYLPERIKILIVGKTGQDIRYIYNALTSSRSDYYDVDISSVNQINYYELLSYDIVIFSNVCYLKNEQIARLKELVSKSTSIVVFPGDDCDLGGYNNLWHNILGFPKLVKFLGSKVEEAFVSLGKFDREHQLFVNVFRKDVDILSNVRFFKVPVFDIDNDDHAIIYYSDGNPFLIECKDDSRTLGFLIATGIDGRWSDLPFKGFFPVLLNRIIAYLSNTSSFNLIKSTGEQYVIENVGKKAVEEIKMVGPDKRVFYPLIERNKLVFDRFDDTGFFEVYSENSIMKELAVNISLSEIGNSFLDQRTFERRYKVDKNKFVWIDLNEKSKENYTMIEKKDLSTIFIILVVSLLIIETFLSRINRVSSERDGE
ncbi:MAG: BatA domain-containing protein [Candidatus Marinimicrobia bacterium]|nr:BatA domain-containing protein [Candidatus Neomarinimicrobiota bacterium]